MTHFYFMLCYFIVPFYTPAKNGGWMQDLGAFLVEQSVITAYELEQAEQEAKACGSPLPRIILAEGFSAPLKLYDAIAKYYKLPFANLETYPSDPALIDPEMAENYHEYNVIPWKTEGKKTVLAITEPSEALKKWADLHYGDTYSFAITSPYDLYLAYSEHFGKIYDHQARELLYERHPEFSAKHLIANHISKRLIGLGLIFSGIIVLNPLHVVTGFFLGINVFYAATLLLRVLLMVIGTLRSSAESLLEKPNVPKDENLPIYTILAPLYQETKVLERLVGALRKLDYPAAKLDIKLIVEEDDHKMIEAIKALKCERMFEMIRVPYSLPRTKPKACNYALQYARGEYAVIYDAEDIPDPSQLKQALAKFKESPDEVVCLQARLNFFNYKETTLTRMFAFEYSNLFDHILFGLQAMGIPIPLGGTSNHFRLDKLKDLYAWDPYNVTEDADLGIRIAQKGWKTRMLDSITNEEAPLTFNVWLKQRTRWIKGHMQTYLVHMRQPFSLLRKVGLTGFLGIQFFLGVPSLIFMIAPIMWSIWLILIIGGIEMAGFMPLWFKPVLYFSYGILVFGVWAQIAMALMAMLKHRDWKGMLPYCFIYPFYWFLHSVASFRAVWHLIKKPHHWEKTMHGMTKNTAHTV